MLYTAMTPQEALKAAIAQAGTEAEFARKLGVTPQAVNQWEVAPPLRALQIERETGISRHDLCPELYPIEKADAA
jgi:DNA-binding transcriptional regulator YdaS (Cro superfamily)